MSRRIRGGLATSLVVLVLLLSTLTSVLSRKSMLVWPVVAPTRVVGDAPSYDASGWTVSSPFGWRPNPDAPGQYEWHDGIDLTGPPFCRGCPIPPMGDVVVTQVGWDQPWSDDPLGTGLGVVVDMALQHPEEAGRVTLRYGHLQPYRVAVRTRSCTRSVDCPRYQADPAGAVSVTCPGRVIEQERSGASTTFVYATPGDCMANVSWPADYAPQGPTTLRFTQQIQPGDAASDAAITFDAELPPPPPTPTPTPALPLPEPES